MQTIVKCATICLVLILNSCVTRQQIEAATWLNNFKAVPKEYCGTSTNRGPLWDYGFYRKLNTGKYQFISLCTNQGSEMFSVTDSDYQKILEAALPKGKQ
jgi:hypothetical protein